MDNYVGKLQEIMVKEGITPIYDLIENNSGTHINTFKMRLTCQSRPGGSTNIVYGEGLSKKAAKHAAALIFLQKYLNECNNNNNDNNDDNISDQTRKQIVCSINVKSLSRIVLLQMICVKNDFEKAEYVDVLQAGPSHSPKFTVACKVGNLRSEGEGTKKADARLEAATKMIQLLMEAQHIYEIFESAQLKLSSNNNNNGEIVCLSDNITGPRIPNVISIFGKKSRGLSPERSTQLEIRVKSPKSMPVLIKSISDVGENDENISNSVCRISFGGTNDNHFETEVLLSKKEKSKSLNNLTDCILDNEGASSSLIKDSIKKRTHLQAVKKIDKALENVESMLYDEIRDTLKPRDSKVQKKITILYNEFDVFINHGTQAKITDGCNLCVDKSIRIACLSKLLIDLKEHAINNC